jgi:aryl-alcohol dehydrogenase-like predicted oxidoreductase
MRMHLLGRTGIAVSEIGFGTGDNAGLLVKGDARVQIDAVYRALEAGVNYFDTAPAYGMGLGEFNLGRVLNQVELYPNHIGSFERAIEASTEASLARLGMDAVDVLMIHNSVCSVRQEYAGGWMPVTTEEFIGPVREGLQRVLQKGKARHVGFIQETAEPVATHNLYDTELFEVVNLMFSLVNPSVRARFSPNSSVDVDYGGVLDGAEAHNMGVAIVRPLAGGLLTDAVVDRGLDARHPVAGTSESFEAALGRAREFMTLRDKTGLTLTEISYRYLLSQPDFDVVVGGFSELRHLEDCLTFAGHGPLDADLLALVEAAMR